MPRRVVVACALVLLVLGGAATGFLLLRRGEPGEKTPPAALGPDRGSAARKSALDAARALQDPLTRGDALLEVWRHYPDTQEGYAALRDALGAWTMLCRRARAPSKLTPSQANELSVLRDRAPRLLAELAAPGHPLEVEAQRLALEAAERAGDAQAAARQMPTYVRLLIARKGRDGAARQLLDESILLVDQSLLIDREECSPWTMRRLERIRADLPDTAAAPEAEIWRLWIDGSVPGRLGKLAEAIAAAPKSQAARRAYIAVVNHLTATKDYDRALKLLDIMGENVPEGKQVVDFQRARVYLRQGRTQEGAAVLEPYTRRPHPRGIRRCARELIERATALSGRPRVGAGPRVVDYDKTFYTEKDYRWVAYHDAGGLMVAEGGECEREGCKAPAAYYWRARLQCNSRGNPLIVNGWRDGEDLPDTLAPFEQNAYADNFGFGQTREDLGKWVRFERQFGDRLFAHKWEKAGGYQVVRACTTGHVAAIDRVIVGRPVKMVSLSPSLRKPGQVEFEIILDPGSYPIDDDAELVDDIFDAYDADDDRNMIRLDGAFYPSFEAAASDDRDRRLVPGVVATKEPGRGRWRWSGGVLLPKAGDDWRCLPKVRLWHRYPWDPVLDTADHIRRDENGEVYYEHLFGYKLPEIESTGDVDDPQEFDIVDHIDSRPEW